MKQTPMIEKVMTSMPHSIGSKMTIKDASKMMKENHFRHLPVEEGGRLVGILTDRDIKLAASFGDEKTLIVEEVMTQDPYTIKPHTPLFEVVMEMAEKKIGSAIIQQDNGKVVGIFTSTDGLRILADELQKNYKALTY